ncbi:MAG: ABC transporter ATP-binding protein [Ruminococcaceae bacterium]|nr:ABC transporter ATP-binding protein [Oscillospiraceae bacterium]
MKIKLPEEVYASFRKKGILTDEALLFLKTDMGREELYCDAYTLVTEEGIATLFCLDVLKEKKGASLFSPRKSEAALRELDYRFLPMEEIDSIKCEELLSVLRVIVTRKDGQQEVLFYATAACRKRIFSFTERFDKWRETGEIPEEKKERGGVCPKCHRPYDDPEKKICNHCVSKMGLVRKLLPFFVRYRKQIALVFLTVLFSSALSVVTPYLNSKVLYDDVLNPGSLRYGAITGLVLSIAFAGLLRAFVTTVNGIIGAKVSAFVSCDLKKTIFSSFERLSFSFFTSRHTGRLITQINSDAETLYWFFCDGVPYFLTNVIQMIGITVVMFTIHVPLTILILIPIPLMFLGYFLALRLFRRLHAENHAHRSRFNGVLSDVLGGMRIVKAFSREQQEIRRFDDKSRRLADSKLEIDVKNHTIFPLLNLGIRLSTYLVWGFGGYFVVKGLADPNSGISYGVLNLFVSYLAMLYTPLNFFANFLSHMANGMNALQRLFSIMDADPDVVEKEEPVSLSQVRGEVEFDHVNFSYAPGKKTIQDVSFRVEAGKALGIVGHTGAGKSTLANLLTRLYDVDSGSISIDGVDLRDLSIRTIRDHVAIVSQETYLFRGSILDNIRYASPDATVEEVLAASKAAGCHDFIMSFPDGYNTLVGSDKKSLSGGEKQRVSIARAILKDPAILILDEATAAMDTKTERKIQEALRVISKDRTTITIAHRLSTLRDSDFLIVIEEGKMVETGTHEELLAKDGVYNKLYTLQMEALKTIGIEE